MRNSLQHKFLPQVHHDRPPSVALARQLLAAWARQPRPLSRPVLIFSGWMVPHWWVSSVHNCLIATALRPDKHLHRITCDAREPLPQLGRRVAEQFAEEEVDVVAVSMGGILAREAARSSQQPSLQIARLFTLATPHRGARAVARIVPHHQAQAVVKDSAYLRDLNADPSTQSFPIETFRLHGDHLISSESAHAVGHAHYDWPCAPFSLPAHTAVSRDPRVLMMVAGKLLGYL